MVWIDWLFVWSLVQFHAKLMQISLLSFRCSNNSLAGQVGESAFFRTMSTAIKQNLTIHGRKFTSTLHASLYLVYVDLTKWLNVRLSRMIRVSACTTISSCSDLKGLSSSTATLLGDWPQASEQRPYQCLPSKDMAPYHAGSGAQGTIQCSFAQP